MSRIRCGVLACVLAAGGTASAQTMYFADIFVPTSQDGSIKKVPLTGGTPVTVVPDLDGLLSMDIDQANGKIYFVLGPGAAVKRCNLDGTGIETVTTDLVQFPSVVRINPVLGRVIWGDQTAEEIDYTPLGSTGTFAVVTTPFHRGLAIDAAGAKMYWSTDINSTSGSIIRGDAFGGSQTPIVTGIGKPAAIAIDPAGGKMYWTDYVTDTVRSRNIDGSGTAQILFQDQFGQNPRGIAVDHAGGKVYWGQDISGEPDTGQIMSMNLDGTQQAFFIQGLGLVQDIVIVSGAAPPPCYANCDGSTAVPVLNVADFTCFLTKFASADPYANCDSSTTAPVHNVADFTCFLTKFAAGCP